MAILVVLVVPGLFLGGRWAITAITASIPSGALTGDCSMLTSGSVLQHTQQTTAKQLCPTSQTQTATTIKKENVQVGSSGWQLTQPSTTTGHEIEGYAKSNSIFPGQQISFSVRTTASTFNADIYRMGWYGGDGARLMQSVTGIAGHAYTIPTMDANYLVEANWPTAFSITPGADWVSGVYMVKLTDSNGYQSYIPFVVKTPTALNAFVMVHAVNTDEAYNYYGGASLYPGIRPGPIGASITDQQASQVSFDRPFIQNFGAGQFFRYEYPFIRWAERAGYNLSYVTDTDIHEDANVLMNTKGVLIVGHNEYWSKQMRAAYDAAVAHGVNLANFAANSSYWQMRYAADASGSADRRIVAYKGTAASNPPYNGDPEYNVDNSVVTTNFGDPLINHSEQYLLGMRWQGSYEPLWAGPFKVQLPPLGVFQSPQQDYSWLYAGTGLQNGSIIDNLVGYEYDTVDSTIPGPQTLQIVGKNTFTDVWKNSDTVFTTIYTAPSGARVFDAGTIDWAWGVDTYAPQSPDPYANRPQVPTAGIKAVQQITENILNNFLGSPAIVPEQSPPDGSGTATPPGYTTGAVMFGPQSTTTTLTAGDTSWKNYRVSFSVTPNWSTASSQHAGVQVRINGSNFIWVFLRPTGVRWAQNTSSGATGEKALTTAAIASGQTYTMQVDAYNNLLYVTFNGKAVGTIDVGSLGTSSVLIHQAPSYASGGIRVYSTGTTSTAFKDVAVAALVAASTTSSSSSQTLLPRPGPSAADD